MARSHGRVRAPTCGLPEIGVPPAAPQTPGGRRRVSGPRAFGSWHTMSRVASHPRTSVPRRQRGTHSWHMALKCRSGLSPTLGFERPESPKTPTEAPEFDARRRRQTLVGAPGQSGRLSTYCASSAIAAVVTDGVTAVGRGRSWRGGPLRAVELATRFSPLRFQRKWPRRTPRRPRRSTLIARNQSNSWVPATP
jgi:hypothetical protein